MCHCSKGQSCHAEILIKKFVEVCPNTYDRNAPEQRLPTSSELNLLAAHRQEQLSDDGSSADENVPEKGAGWMGVGFLRYKSESGTPSGITAMVRVSDLRGAGQSRAGGIRAQRKVMAKVAKFVDARCTPSLLMALVMWKVETCPFDETEIAELKGSIVAGLTSDGFELKRQHGDREDVPIDFVFWDCSSVQLMILRWG